MIGKVLKVFSNDINGNVDDRKVAVFGAFNHLKYMNRYIIFAIIGEYGNKKLCYGSVHQKKDSLIVFGTPESNVPIIDDFTNSLLNNNIDPKDYKVLDISDCEKIELISYNQKDFDKLPELDSLTIEKEAPKSVAKTNKKESSATLYILLVIFILLGLGVTYLYLNPSILKEELKQLSCQKEAYNEKVNMNYHSERIVRFNREEEPVSINTTDTYKFDNIDAYNDFKENKKENTYFTSGEYKYNDDALELKIFTEEKTIIDNYDEMKSYLKNEKYTCTEETYNG